MHLQHLNGTAEVLDEQSLLLLLSKQRNGVYGAFILWHLDGGPSLWVHINGTFAYLHFFRAIGSEHPGFQSIGMAPPNFGETTRFLTTTGCEADAISVLSDTLVPDEAAYKAAVQFLKEPGMPSSIQWFEL